MPTPETHLTDEQLSRARALGVAREALGYRRPLLDPARTDEVADRHVQQLLRVAQWVLGDPEWSEPLVSVVVGDPAVPGTRERPLAFTDEVWTVDTDLSANTTEAALRCWEVTPDGTFVERTVEHLADDLLDEDLPEAEVLDDEALRPNAGPCPLCDEVIAAPLLAGHLQLHEEETDRG